MLIETLVQRLNEFFVDVTEDNVVFSLGDLFDPSQFRLRDVFLRTELFNALHLPFELKSGYIGDVKVEGFLGVVAGFPLTIHVDNVCLVLGHKPVDWNDDLAMRYAKDLLVAILQSIAPTPPGAKQKKSPSSDSFSMSPAKWIVRKIQATLAETTVGLERLHIRFESDVDGHTIAYGVHIPSVKLTTRETDDQILNRREQPGVKYPKPSNDTATKRLFIGDVAVYCDLHATSFLGPTAPPTRPLSATPRSTVTSPPVEPALTASERMEYVRNQCKQPFTLNADRDLVHITALWLKLDFVRPPDSYWTLGAMDIVTEAINVNGDLAQLRTLKDEVAKVKAFFQRTRRQQFRPCGADREHTSPLKATLSSSNILPVVTGTSLATTSTDRTHRQRSRAWLRDMWKYAARCVLMDRRTKAAANRVRLGAVDSTLDDNKRQRYISLYKRSLSEDALTIVVLGKSLLPSSPRATDARRKQAILPVYEPLSREEQWELSDLVDVLSIWDQRRLRYEAAQAIRLDYAACQANNAVAPVLSSPSQCNLSVSVTDPTESSASSARERSTSVSPRRQQLSGSAPSSPQRSPSSRHSMVPTSLLDAAESLPPDFLAHHHAHYTRARAESSPAGSPTKLDTVVPPSPTGSPRHGGLSHSASAPVTRHKLKTDANATTAFMFHTPLSPSSASKQHAFVSELVPSWMMKPKRTIPLINWHIGPVSVRIHHRTTVEDEASVFPLSPTTAKIPPRSVDAHMEITFDGCTGCLLFCKVPSVSFLIEVRVGRMKASLIDKASSFASSSSEGNSIATDYIREPSDGFLYLGIKYNFKSAASIPVSLLPTTPPTDIWDVKVKVCAGTIRIQYNDMAMQTALRTSQRSSRSSQPVEPPRSIRLDSVSYVTIVQDVLANWQAFVQRPHSSAKSSSPRQTSRVSKPPPTPHQIAAKHERVSKLLDLLMHLSSCVDVDLNGMELDLSMLTSHVVEHTKSTPTSPLSKVNPPLPMYDSEHVQITLPTTSAGFQNRTLLNECHVHAGGARVKFHTTKQGRAAVVDHILRRLFPSHHTS